MRNIIFTAPFPMETTMLFAQALRGLSDIRLLGVFQKAPTGPARGWFDDLVLVDNALDPEEIVRGCRILQDRYGQIHRLLGILEDLQEQVATAREVLGLEGPSLEVTRNFRDKGRMKSVLREAGLPTAAHAYVREERDAWELANRVGFPLIIKPPAGAGSRATLKVEDAQQLTRTLAEIKPGAERVWLAEEFLSGREFTWETVTIGGTPVFESIGRYYPGPLDVVRNDWMQWIVVLPRDISGPEFDDVKRVGRKTISALGLCEGMTHMEWFRRPDGSIAISEVGARPPGAQFTTLLSAAHDLDFYRVWPELLIQERFQAPPRKYSAGAVYLRGQGSGRVKQVHGLDEVRKDLGELVVEARLPQPGQPRASSYEGEGYVLLRHPDTSEVERGLAHLLQTLRVELA